MSEKILIIDDEQDCRLVGSLLKKRKLYRL